MARTLFDVMTHNEALLLLDSASGSDDPSRINPVLTEAQLIECVRHAVQMHIDNGYGDAEMDDLLEKRVRQMG